MIRTEFYRKIFRQSRDLLNAKNYFQEKILKIYTDSYITDVWWPTDYRWPW